jgi:transcriptional regulator with XRE-family HTH domain
MTKEVIKFLTMQSPAESFAKWMAERREELKITLDVLEERTGVRKQHLSALERAAPHSLTGKPVIPKRKTVEKIANGLGADLSEALAAAGYASVNQANNKYIEIGLRFGNLPISDQKRLELLYEVLDEAITKAEQKEAEKK